MERQQQVQVNLANAETIACEKCKSQVFVPGFLLKRLSILQSPTGREEIVPVQIMLCAGCGEAMLPGGM
jgi:hypothetical protein